MDELIVGIRELPGWVQGCLAFFVFALFVMLFETSVRNRGVARRFAALAASRQATVRPGDDAYSASFEVTADGRPLTVRREMRSTGGGGSYRGPRGFLTLVEAPLAGSRWAMHNVDVAERGTLARLGSTPMKTGDATFDRRFTVWQDGLVVRDGWLDAPTREAFTALFDVPSMTDAGTVWVTEGRLQCFHDTPKTLDAARFDTWLSRVATLAAALERTGGWRGPAA